MEGMHTNGKIDNKLQDCQNETLFISEMKYRNTNWHELVCINFLFLHKNHHNFVA